MLYIGIDPGRSGGIAMVRDDGYVCYAEKMPETERDIWELMKALAPPGGAFALIEKVHAMPKQGVTSTFKFGLSYGGLRMALVAAGFPFDEVTPQTWQKAMGCMSKGVKNITKQKAQQLFPDRTITHAVADSLLIAEYLRRTHARVLATYTDGGQSPGGGERAGDPVAYRG